MATASITPTMSETLTTSTSVSDLQIQTSTSVNYKIRPEANWVKRPFKERNIWERIATLDLASDKCYVVQPKNPNPPPKLSVWRERLWLTVTIAPPLIFQALWYYVVPENNYFHTWHPVVAFIFYHLFSIIYTVTLIRHLTHYMSLYGTFDEHNRPRDHVPDKEIRRLVISVILYTVIRTGGGLILGGYNRYVSPSLGNTISWLFPIKIGLWLISLDFFFYFYHRAVHRFPFLWRYHSKHHATKHPTPIQSILADDLQEMTEVILIPWAASLIMPMTAHEFWIAQCVLMYVEGMGHSGVRAYWTHPMCGELLRPFKMDLTIEDHDLHHRLGKSGQNYGKQTRIFDRLFNTITERIEGIEK